MERVIEFKGASNTLHISDVLAQYLQVDEINIEVTCDKPRAVILPDYSALININLKINIFDKTGTAATNNITIITNGSPDLVNGASSVLINTNYGFGQVTGATLNKTKQWICLFGGASSSSSGGGGGGNIPSQIWTLAASCNIGTGVTTFLATTNQTIPHPFSITVFYVNQKTNDVIVEKCYLGAVSGGGVVFFSPSDISLSDIVLIDSMGNWSNVVSQYSCIHP